MGNKEDEKKPKEATLLQELCGADAELYACLSTLLYENPLAAISPKDLDSLTQEADKSGQYRPALDKAIFEGARNPDERERYITAIQDLALKSIHAMEQRRETALKEGLTDLAATLGRGIESRELMREKAVDMLRVASQYYSEKLTTLAEDKRREERLQGKRVMEKGEKKIGEIEKAGREARKQARRGMGGRERREAKKEDRREELAAAKRKEARGEDRRATEREETRIGEAEKAGREARRAGRKGK